MLCVDPGGTRDEYTDGSGADGGAPSSVVLLGCGARQGFGARSDLEGNAGMCFVLAAWSLPVIGVRG